MKAGSFIFLISLLIVLTGCSNTRFLTKDQALYTGHKKTEIINRSDIRKISGVKNQVSSTTTHKVNNAIFGRRVLPPVGLWVHNYWKVKKSNKLFSWVYKTLSSSPVLVSDVNPDLRTKKIENDLFDMGYFHARAWSVIDTGGRNHKKARVKYFVDLSPPYHFNKILNDTLPDHLDSLIMNYSGWKKIKPGDQFNLDILKSLRDILAREIQDSGYFYFMPEFIELRADTTGDKHELNLYIGKRNILPESVLSIFRINNVIINNSQGTVNVMPGADTVRYGGVTIVSVPGILNNDVLLASLFINPGDKYSYSSYQKTLNRLNNLGIFKSVNISFVQNKRDSLSYLLDVVINLVMAENITVDYEANLMTKSSGYFGPLLSAGISNRNTFNGAELLKLALTGGFEWQWGVRSANQLGTYSYQFGLASGLSFPKIILPLSRSRKNSLLLQRTSVNLDLNLLNRVAYYKLFSIKTNINYLWSKNKNIQHSLFPLYINSVNLLATTPAFDSVVNRNIYIRKSFEEEFIIGPRYEFSYNNTLTVKPVNFFYQAGINTSANLIDLFAGIGKSPAGRPYSVFGNVYSEYIKFTSDFRYYRNWYKKSFVFRFYTGIGIPYGNSTALPYVEQFFSGGAYSIRAFTARYVGPGSFHAAKQIGYVDQSGDLKLESNLEFRFDMTKLLKGALFIDMGNIWLVNEDINRPGAKFDINTFYDQIAVGTGFGLRFDFTFFVLRADVGFPLRTPYKTDGENWLSGVKNILSGGLLNLAIGYPF